MNREVILTADGSTTIKIKDWDEQYHSLHGAIVEANHVFISYGLDYVHQLLSNKNSLQLLEIGFGTGLNAWLTAMEAQNRKLKIEYEGIEAYPVAKDELNQLNYAEILGMGKRLFKKIHCGKWDEFIKTNEFFNLKKSQIYIQDLQFKDSFDLIYFDAFGARVQPELWTESVFQNMFKALRQDGVLVTYSARGSVRRAMIAAGFKVEKLPGPPGKREMLRANKL